MMVEKYKLIEMFIRDGEKIVKMIYRPTLEEISNRITLILQMNMM